VDRICIRHRTNEEYIQSLVGKRERKRLWKTRGVDGMKLKWILMKCGVSKSFRTGRLVLELQMVQLSATRCSCITILWVSLVSFAAITLCVVSQPVFIFVSGIFRYRLSPENFGYTLVDSSTSGEGAVADYCAHESEGRGFVQVGNFFTIWAATFRFSKRNAS
jgi:hypothetical protein